MRSSATPILKGSGMSAHSLREVRSLRAQTRIIGVTLLVAFLSVQGLAAKTGKVIGVIFTLGENRVQTLWPNARVT